MSEMSTLRLTLQNDGQLQEFLRLAQDSVIENKSNPECTYIEAWQSVEEPLTYMIVSVWNSEQALLEWYRSPFHMELRKQGLASMLASYSTYQSAIDEKKCHSWNRKSR